MLGREDVDDVAADAKRAAPEVDFVARVLHLRQPADHVVLPQRVALLEVQDHAVVFGRVSDAVDRGDRRHDHAIGALEDRLGRRQAHLLDVLVDRAVLLDVEVARRDVRFRLIVVVVRDEVLDGVVREELAEFGVELRGQRLVGREHERRAAGLRDDVRHRERLARAGDAEERLEREAVGESLEELRDGFRLVAGGLEGLEELVRAVRIGDEHVGVDIQTARQPIILLRIARSTPVLMHYPRELKRGQPRIERARGQRARRASPPPRGGPLPALRSGPRAARSRGDAR